MEGIGWYTHELVRRMAAAHPEVSFHLLFDRRPDPAFVYSPNVYAHILRPPARHPVLWYWWFEVSVPAALRRIKPQVFFSPDNFLCLRTEIPTVITCHDLLPFSYPQGIPALARAYYMRYWPKYLRKARHVITVSETTRSELEQRFQLPDNQVTTVYNACREGFKPLSVSSRLRQMPVQLTTPGKPSLTHGYFLAAGSIHPRKNLVRLIAAFELFKHTTGLPHQLVFAGRMAWQHTEVEQALSHSSYRADIIMTGYVSETDLQILTRNAIASVYVSLMEGFGLPIIEAMQSGVPVITSSTSSMPEIAGDAALLVDPHSVESIAEGMISVATQPDLHDRLRARGLIRAQDFSWDTAAEQVFNILRKTAGE